MDNRALIAIILSVFILIAYQYFFPATNPEPPKPKQVAEKTEKKEEVPLATNVPVIVTPGSSDVKDIKVETDMYIATLTSMGGTIKSWIIKPYKDAAGANVVILKKPGILPAMSIGTDNNFNLSALNFNILGSNLKLDSNNPSGSITFEYDREGFSVKRTYTFYAGTYRVDITDEVTGAPEYWISTGSDFGIFDSTDTSLHVGPTLLVGTDIKELKQKDMKDVKTFKGDLKWIAQQDKYFFAGLVPLGQVDEARAWMFNNSPIIAFKAKSGINKFLLYAGPKEHDRLKQLNVGLEHIVDFGFFSILARPLFWILKIFYKLTGNYGWAIILLTIITRIPFIPIISKQQDSMKKLQAIQPKMNEIREKYKKDPKKMQQELSELYKKHKVNPMGGCLPLLLQIPVFFALYKVLLVAIELRGAPFMLWITDLSAKDPYYILPVVMGITMIIQQKMTPSTMDPNQAKIMMLMPVIFTFMFLNFASGLVLYWLVSNIFSITQQFYINRKNARLQAATG